LLIPVSSNLKLFKSITEIFLVKEEKHPFFGFSAQFLKKVSCNVLALAGVAEIHNLSPKISKISIQVVFLRKEKRAIAANAC